MPRASSGSFFSSPQMETRVLEDADRSRHHRRHRALGLRALAILDEAHRAPGQLGQRPHQQRQAHVGAVLRPWAGRNATAAARSRPRSLSSAIVGTAARSLVSSLIAPSCIGTLKSTRTSTRLPVRSAGRSSRVLKLGHSAQLGHRRGGVDHAVRKAPFIVVPADHADQLAFEHRGLEAVDGRARRIVVEVDRDQGLVGVSRGCPSAARSRSPP